MDKDILKGFKIAFGFTLFLAMLFGVVYAVGFHTADEILSGTFLGNYSFNGNVGIGTSSSSSALDVNGTVNIAGDINFSGNITGDGSALTNLPAGGVLVKRTVYNPTTNHMHYNGGTMPSSGTPTSSQGVYAYDITNTFQAVDINNDFYITIFWDYSKYNSGGGTIALYRNSETNAIMWYRDTTGGTLATHKMEFKIINGMPSGNVTFYVRHGYHTYDGYWSNFNGNTALGGTYMIIDEIKP